MADQTAKYQKAQMWRHCQGANPIFGIAMTLMIPPNQKLVASLAKMDSLYVFWLFPRSVCPRIVPKSLVPPEKCAVRNKLPGNRALVHEF